MLRGHRGWCWCRWMTLRVCPGVAGMLFLVVRQRIECIKNVRVYVYIEFRGTIVIGFDPP
jgi:hypothetical protein